MNNVNVKCELLSYGVRISKSAITHYGRPYLAKRRAYGNPDPLALISAAMPQELYIPDPDLVCAVNIRSASPWEIDWVNGKFILVKQDSDYVIPLEFPRHPAYYDLQDNSGFSPASVVTLYGGAALGIFVYGDCVLVNRNQACHYCSIGPNRARESEFLPVISAADVERAIQQSLASDNGTIKQIMLNGGNFPDLNKSFAYYIGIAKAARRAVDSSSRNIPIHLIAFPPDNLELIDQLVDLDISISFNTEIFDEELFKLYCPGKFADGGHSLLFSALEVAAKKLGPQKVFSIFVGGLEPIESLNKGMKFVSNLGTIPVVNIFHADPQTPLANYPVISPAKIFEMGQSLQTIYKEINLIEPFYFNCGRNSIDTEAFLGLF